MRASTAEPALTRLLLLALAEDAPSGDATSEAVLGDEELVASGRFVARAPCVLAGTRAAAQVFTLVDPEAKLSFQQADGARLEAGQAFGIASGRATSLLLAERTALNLMQRLSGIATLTRRFVDAVAGTRAQVVDTRKTTPGLRALEKAAVRAGGGRNHRHSLSDGVLIKTNHVRVAGSVAEAVARARRRACHTLRVEVEVRDLLELGQAIEDGADACLLDNMTPQAMREAVAQARGRVLLEASGGVRLENVREVAGTGVDLVSVGALTHSAPAADLAFEVGIEPALR
jgi:nicotinate-nucleotide pyrophosphorylase (carboxylating)